ncbi:hypothetical protein ABN034_22560 [Actinopolymorpha sp. B11F2]|uniref:hypothetical protein n=1 Tax=Actinopolymorpha sp. B11F2 TaxID=3160862 RepID=UPI0032E50045
MVSADPPRAPAARLVTVRCRGRPRHTGWEEHARPAERAETLEVLEAGEHLPDDHYQKLIAQSFGTVQHAIFPAPTRRDADADLLAATGLGTLEILARVQRSDVDNTTIDALRIIVDRLCSDYPSVSADQLLTQGRLWLARVAELRNGPLTLAQHREVLALAGWLALLVGCVENDMGDRPAAEATRRAALSIGTEAGHGEIQAWAHEMRAWFSLTTGDYRGVIEAAKAGAQVASGHSVAVQLAGQEAKAWARLGNRRHVEVSLDRGRDKLEALPYPDKTTDGLTIPFVDYRPAAPPYAFP